MSGRRIWLALALVIAVAVVALGAWSTYVALQKSPAERAGAAGPGGVSAVDLGPAPDASLRPIVGAPTSIQDIAEFGEDMRIVGMDRSDPSRIAYELVGEQFEPQEGHRFLVNRPQAALHFKNGHVVHVQADSMTCLKPPGAGEPQSGRFVGNLVCRVFDAPTAEGLWPEGLRPTGEDGRTAPDLAPDIVPLFTLATDSMSFDLLVGEFSTLDPVKAWGGGLDVRFTGLRANIDEPGKRLAYLRTERDGEIRFSPRRRDSQDSSSGAAGTEPDAGHGPAPVAAEQWQRAEFEGDVSLSFGGREICSDALLVWARLLDGRLPADAVSDLRFKQTQDAAAATSSQGGARPAPDEPILLTWSGPLVVNALEESPPELAADHLAARFTSPQAGVVRGQDDASGASAIAAAIDYGLTSSRLVLTGPGPRGVILTLPDVAEAQCGRFELLLREGIGALRGVGLLRAIGQAAQPGGPDPFEPPRRREIAWQDHCDLLFETRNGAIDFDAPSPLREALFHGRVEARDAKSLAAGDFVRTVFAASPAGDPSIARLVIDGSAHVDLGPDGRLMADRIDAAFAQSSRDGRAVPRTATAQGRVRGERSDANLSAEMIEADFETDASGETRLSRFAADFAVRLARPDGLELLSDRLRYDAEKGEIELVGEPAVAHRQGGSISGASMRFGEHDRRLMVYGAGVFNYSQPREAAFGYERVQIEWRNSMTYDDAAGRAEFVGACVATAEPDDVARDEARGHRIVLDLSPNAAAEADAGRSAAQAILQRATIFGAVTEFEGGEPATAESRRYEPDPASESGLRLIRMLHLAGATIVADAAADTLTVPGAGRLLIEDRVTDEDEPAPDDEPASLRGTTLFEWDGSMTIDRAEGHAMMAQRVRLRQRPPQSESVTELECERLDAWLAGSDAMAERRTLERVEAAGAVYAAQRGRRLIADLLRYDAASGVAEALAAPGNLVTMFDAGQSSPLTGALLRWDLTRDRVEWLEAGETTAPR